MDKLDDIFRLQAELNREIREKRSLSFSSGEWIQKLTLAMLSELAELLDEVNFKWWKNPKEIDERLVKEELVDILHFFVSMCLDAGMTPEEMHRMYLEKHQENLDRQHGKSLKEGYALDELKRES
ncbi:MAG: dUTPase [Eubacteriales bacterium]|nr:dUTPase [Eubacteriales bacterium]